MWFIFLSPFLWFKTQNQAKYTFFTCSAQYFHLKKCIYQLFLEFVDRGFNSSHLRKVLPVYFNQIENIRQFQKLKNAQTKNRKPLTIGTLAPLLPFNMFPGTLVPLLPFNMFLLHRSLSKSFFLTVGDACLYLLQMSSLHTDFMVHSFWKSL